MSKRPGGARGASAAPITALCVLFATACGPYYHAPAVPTNQLARVTLDSRATILDVDGLPLPPSRSDSGSNNAKEFFVGAGCRQLTAKYEESYFIWGAKKASKEGLGYGLGPALAKTEVHDYETMKPIRFFIPAKAGRKYWVTATFTGDQFLPRVVEIEQSGDSVGTFLPDVPCNTNTPPSP